MRSFFCLCQRYNSHMDAEQEQKNAKKIRLTSLSNCAG